MPLRTDIWRLGLVKASLETILRAGDLSPFDIVWGPQEPAFAFLADPFGLWRDDVLHVFAEAYDYRSRHGVIHLLRYDGTLTLLDRWRVLSEPWHLSYPQVFEAEGETWMLPEAFRSGTLTLYRAKCFPYAWERVTTIPLDEPAIDATPFRHDGLWWLAYSPSRLKSARQARLHLAYAERLTGPWTAHPGNPVRIDRSSARPGGTAVVGDDSVVLPMQDCTRTYGGAIRPLRISRLSPDAFEAETSPPIRAPLSAWPEIDGLHTLSAAGDVTLIDVKRIDRSPAGLAIDAGRALGFWRG